MTKYALSLSFRMFFDSIWYLSVSIRLFFLFCGTMFHHYATHHETYFVVMMMARQSFNSSSAVLVHNFFKEVEDFPSRIDNNKRLLTCRRHCQFESYNNWKEESIFLMVERMKFGWITSSFYSNEKKAIFPSSVSFFRFRLTFLFAFNNFTHFPNWCIFHIHSSN